MPTSDDNDYRQRLDNFYSVLKQKLQNYRDTKQHLDRFLSTDFNVFEWTTSDEKRLSEMRLSAIIAGMLDPDRSHGQQRMFLDAFLRRIDKCYLLNRHVKSIHCEYKYSEEGRIDILVDFRDFGIGIENKPRAGDQDEQLRKYHDYLKKRYNNQFCLIYLTLDKRRPPENSIRADLVEELIRTGQLRLVSYSKEILEWLRECVQLCESDKFRWFLRDFMDYIRTMIEGRRQMPGEEDIIIRHALESRENLEMTLGIHLAGDELCKQLIKDFLMKLRKCLDEHLEKPQWKFVDDGLLKEPLRNGSFAFAKTSWNEKYSIKIQRYQGRIEYGVAKETESRERIPNLEGTLNDAMPKAGRWHSCWEWYRYWEDRYGKWDTKEALLNIKDDGDAVNQLCNDLILIMKKATPFIDNVSSNP